MQQLDRPACHLSHSQIAEDAERIKELEKALETAEVRGCVCVDLLSVIEPCKSGRKLSSTLC